MEASPALQYATVRDVLSVIFKHKAKILTVFCATVGTIIVGTVWFATPRYEATARLMIKPGREYTYLPEVGNREPLVISNQMEEIINAEIQILTSRDLKAKVISTIGVENLYPQLVESPPKRLPLFEAATLQFEKRFSIERIEKSNVIEVAFQHPDPHMVARVVNLMVQLFQEKHLQVFNNPKATTFLEAQVTAYRQRLQEAEEGLQAFQQTYRIFSQEEQRQLLLRRHMDLETTFQTARHRVQELQQRLSSLTSQIRTMAENVPLQAEVIPSEIFDKAKAELLTLQLREQELLGRFADTNRQVVNVRREIQLVKEFLKGQEESLQARVRTGKNELYQDIEKQIIETKADLRSQEARSAALGRELAQVNQEIQTLVSKENELRSLRRQLAINEQNYQTYVHKLEEARLLGEMDRQKIANISVIEPAAVPVKPVKSWKLLKIALGAVLGATAGLCLAFVTEFLSQGLSTPESSEKYLGLPVLVTVPYITKMRDAGSTITPLPLSKS